MPTIRVDRTASTYGLLRRLKVLVDGRKVASVWVGRSVEVEVTPGVHEIAVQMDWAKTPPLRVDCASDLSPLVMDVHDPGAAGQVPILNVILSFFGVRSAFYGLTLRDSPDPESSVG